MNPSPAWRLNAADLKKWLTNMLVFLAPVVVIYLTSVLGNVQTGFSWSAFALNPATQGALVLYVLNAALDFFKKLSAGQ